ncbi:MAG: AsmA family protein [Pigmentiphaga sp.]
MVWVKRGAIVLAALVVLAALGLAALVAFIDPNDYKPMLQQAVKQRYDRNLAIDGELRLSIFPRLGLEINGVSLSEPGSTQTFAAMDSARVAVAWLPLLSRDLMIEHLTVNGIKANLVRNEAGRFNFHDLLEAEPAAVDDTASDEGGDAGPALDWNIAGVTLEGGELAITDARTGTAFRIERVAAQATGIALGSPFDFSLSGRLLGQQPRADASLQLQGRFTLVPAQSRYRASGFELRLDGVLPSMKANTLALRGTVDVDLEEGSLAARDLALIFQGDVALAAPLQGLDLQVHVPQLFHQWREGRLALESGALQAKGQLDGQAFLANIEAPRVRLGPDETGSEVVRLRFQRDGQGAVSLEADLEGLRGDAGSIQATRLATRGELALPEQRRLGWSLTAAPRWEAKQSRLLLSGLAGTLALRGRDLPEDGLVVPLEAQLDYPMGEQRLVAGGEAELDGRKMAWNVTGQNLGGQPQWALRFKGEALDLDRWWPPAPTSADAQAPASGESAPAKDTKEPLWDPAVLRDRHWQIEAELGSLRARGVTAEQVRLAVAVSEGRAVLKNLQARLFQGTLQASGEAAAADAQLAIKAQLRNVAVQPLLEAVAGSSKLSGRGNLDLTLGSRGVSQAELRQNLAGEIGLQVRDGAIQGINVAQTLREFRNVLGTGNNTTQDADDSRQTDFSELRARGVVAQGVVDLQDVLLSAPLLRVTQGEPARIDLVQDTYDLVVLANVVNTSTGQDGKALEQLRGVSIPIHLTGPLGSPQYAILWSAIGGQALQQVLQNEASRQIDRLLEGRGGDAGGRALGDALKGLLGR